MNNTYRNSRGKPGRRITHTYTRRSWSICIHSVRRATVVIVHSRPVLKRINKETIITIL